MRDFDKFLRIGVSRTDIFGMAAVLNEKYNTNVWKEPAKLDEITTQMETPQIIAKRLQKAYSIFLATGSNMLVLTADLVHGHPRN